MRLLLDTHVFLWWLADDRRLGQASRKAIADAKSLVHVSAVTVWELAIKASLGRIDLGGADLANEIPANGFIELPIVAQHALVAGSLPRHHHDPFDRMLIAQAQVEGLQVVTHDKVFQKYGVPVMVT
ncbi:MAG: type II toxin-antitoxin system VapC family toxin [Deinococcus sp.]|nr:type II toxin-antitoxin system VapC family toxin [Deinococcus sp.]